MSAAAALSAVIRGLAATSSTSSPLPLPRAMNHHPVFGKLYPASPQQHLPMNHAPPPRPKPAFPFGGVGVPVMGGGDFHPRGARSLPPRGGIHDELLHSLSMLLRHRQMPVPAHLQPMQSMSPQKMQLKLQPLGVSASGDEKRRDESAAPASFRDSPSREAGRKEWRRSGTPAATPGSTPGEHHNKKRRRGGAWKNKANQERRSEKEPSSVVESARSEEGDEESQAPPPIPVKTVVSSTPVAGGGTIVSSRDDRGQLYVRVEYTREQFVNCARSPYALLPPAELKHIVIHLPEILASFPRRYRP